MTDRRIAFWLFVLSFVTYAWFFNGGGWNQNAHFDLTRALVEQQTLRIDAYQANTGDVSWVKQDGGWHVYINKPPGVSFLAAIPYAPLYAIERAFGVEAGSWFWVTLNAWLVTMLTCGVAGALIPVVLFRYGRRAGAEPHVAAGVALVVAFCTIVFPYSTMLFAHVPAALFLLLAFLWLDERPLLAGVAAGIAGLSYYLCIPAAAVLFIASWTRSRKAALRFLAGGVPFGLLLALYQQVCFGSPFVTSVETSKGFTEQGLLFGVFRLPALHALWGLTGSEYRGLFFISPILLVGIAGIMAMRRRDLVIGAAISAVFFFAIAGFNGWHGGNAFGPRYLMPIVPFVALPLFSVRPALLARLGIPLALLSFAVHLMATAVIPTPSPRIAAPVQALFSEVLAGHTSMNEQGIDERVPHRRYPRGSSEATWASFNVGELIIGRSGPLTVLPLTLWVLVGSALLLRNATPSQQP